MRGTGSKTSGVGSQHFLHIGHCYTGQRLDGRSRTPVKICLQPLSLMLTAAVTNGIIGKAFKRNLRMVFGHPLIERIMQKEVRQQG